MIKFLKFIPAQLTVLLIVGILIGKYQLFLVNDLTKILISLVVLFSFIYFYLQKQIKSTIPFSLLFFTTTIFIGIAASTFQNPKNKSNYFITISKNSIRKRQLNSIQIVKILKATKFYYKFEAKVVELNSVKVSGKILLNIQKDSLANTLQVDDVILAKAQFKTIPSPKNPNTFNYKKYLENQQIYYQIKLSRPQFKKLQIKKRTIKGIAASFRDKINNSLQKKGFKNDELAVINALLLGQRNTVSSDLLKSYAGAGAIHILAVSGLHIGILLWLLTWLFKPIHYFKNGKTIALLLSIILLWLYAIIAGLSASVVRAVAMFTAIAVGIYTNKSTNIYNTLVISMFFLLLIDPNYLFEVGFQLSYLAVFSIVWLQPKMYNLLNLTNWFYKKIWQLFTVSIAAQIGILPLSIFYFHQFPGLFFVANLVIIPFLGIILTAGILVIIFSLLNILPEFLASAYNFIIHLMNEIVSWIANQHLFLIQNISLSFVLMIAFYILILGSFKWIEKRNFKRLLLVFISIILVQIIFISEKYQRQTTHGFIVFNKSKKSIIGVRKGEQLMVHSSDNKLDKQSFLNSFIVGTGVQKIEVSNRRKIVYKFKNEHILIIDSLGLYPLKSLKPTLIILQKSPKINLERLFNKLHPSIIIADGSNFNSFKKRWSETCKKRKTPFYDTNKKGAFILY